MNALIFALLAFFVAINGEKTESYWYKKGVKAYLVNDWKKCIDHFETAIHMHRQSQRAIASCRLSCAKDPFSPLNAKNIEDLHYYEKMIKKTLCFMKCKRTQYPDLIIEFPVDSESLRDIENLEPYKYLQMCYHQIEQYQKAVSAAFTYIIKHPNDTMTKLNLKGYMDMPEIKQDKIKNFEAEDYFQSYINAMLSYDLEDWEQTIYYMEKALQEYYEAEDKCRVLCEGPFDQGWLPDLTASIANHFTYCLNCKQRCPIKLQSLEGLKGKELLADMYNYLQFAYFHQKMINEACEMVASYLLIHPNDKDMLHNKKLYSTHGTEDMFTPRKDIVDYLNRIKYEKKVLKFINTEFVDELKLHKKIIVLPEIKNDVPQSKNDIPDNK